ncbi:hypothetical protein BGZ76_004102 [Entomortierella beljakovae]|nr:hypothetical protein BGZ76_004102 [Entomortierella beljakovae]
MNVAKAACILVATTCYDYCWTPTRSTYTVSDTRGDKVKPEAPWLNPFVTVMIFRAVVAIISLLYLALMAGGSLISENEAVLQLNDMKPWHWAAIIISLAGVAFRKWAFITLDRFFTYQLTIRKDHKLVHTGPYKYLRHPSYTGGLISALFLQIFLWHQGIYEVVVLSMNWTLAVGNGSSEVYPIIPNTILGIGGGIWVAVFITSLITARCVIRVWDEEAMLSEHFGDEWTVYANRRWRFLQFVY